MERAPSSYLNQSFHWSLFTKFQLIETLGTNCSESLNEIHEFFVKKNACENAVWKMAASLSGPQCVKIYLELLATNLATGCYGWYHSYKILCRFVLVNLIWNRCNRRETGIIPNVCIWSSYEIYISFIRNSNELHNDSFAFHTKNHMIFRCILSKRIQSSFIHHIKSVWSAMINM